jgi:hypothetical protein
MNALSCASVVPECHRVERLGSLQGCGTPRPRTDGPETITNQRCPPSSVWHQIGRLLAPTAAGRARVVRADTLISGRGTGSLTGRVERRDDLPCSGKRFFFDVKRGGVLRTKGWLVIACSAALSLVLTGLAQSASGPRTLRFLELSWPESKSTFVDHNQNNRPDFGDAFISGSDLYSWAGGKRGAHVGVIRLTCTLVGANAGQCQGTFSLPGGTLETAGYIHFSSTTRVPIIGGTGIYFAAQGTFTSRTIGGPDSLKSAATIRLLR